ncbi:ATP-binding protein [Streptomyces sp. H27-H1]|uniref:ATP-binding protein n=1 Tax=Streptomyces sp. H27-H1 TaxID=2996461 RepID=UPI002271FCD7|nr:ATP-binding protein [Streptomyces sp. H27-H1]MCY0928010.1 ATP-binding protein [Streptomyces sp. H27-H1]
MAETLRRPTAPALPGAGITCASARRLARTVLAEADVSPGCVADVLTVVSELVANAYCHAGGLTGFSISIRLGAVVVEVSDPSPQLPQERPWAPDQPGGFGWVISNRLTDSITIDVAHDGKTITALFGART